MTAKKTAAKKAASSSSSARTTSTSAGADDAGQDAAAASAAADDARSRYPLSAIATPEQVAQAGIRNGMSADEIEACLARVMGG